MKRPVIVARGLCVWYDAMAGRRLSHHQIMTSLSVIIIKTVTISSSCCTDAANRGISSTDHQPLRRCAPAQRLPAINVINSYVAVTPSVLRRVGWKSRTVGQWYLRQLWCGLGLEQLYWSGSLGIWRLLMLVIVVWCRAERVIGLFHWCAGSAAAADTWRQVSSTLAATI